VNQRNLLILVLALAVAALAAWLVSPEEGSLGEGDLLLPGLAEKLNEVERVTVRRAGNEAVATLERRETGWVVTDRDGYPANFDRVRQNLRGLADARIFEAKTANPDFYERLGVRDISDDQATGAELDIEAGDYRARVIVGDTDSGAGGQAFVRRAGEAQSYLVKASLDPGRNAGDWLERSVLDIASSRVRSVEIRHPDGEIVAIAKPRSESTNYTVADIPEGRRLTFEGAANAIGAALAGLQLDDVRPAANFEPAAEPVIAIFQTFDGLTVAVRSWTQEDDTLQAFSAVAQTTGERDDAGAAQTSAGGAAGAGTGAAAGEPAAEDAGEGPAAATPPGDADALAGVVAEAETINARLGNWLYTMPSFKAEQFTRRMDDLLAAPE
jgi:hypothetical protein